MNNFTFVRLTDFDQKLPFYFSGVGYNYIQEPVVRPGKNEYQQWMFSDYQWIQTKKGSGELILNENKYIIKEGQGFLLFPNEPHEYHTLSDEEWIVDWIIFKGTSLNDFMSNILETYTSKVFFISNPQYISEKITKLCNCILSSEPTKNISCSKSVYDILIDIFKLTSQKQNTSLIRSSQRLMPVFNYINECFAQPLTLNELAKIVDLTPQHLCHVFKKLTSYTVFEYILMTRIQKSKELLLSGKEIQIKTVAHLSGFNDASYFCTVFNKYEHMTPSQFKETFNTITIQ